MKNFASSANHFACGQLLRLAAMLMLLSPVAAIAQGPDWEPSQTATSAERLLMEQVTELRRAGESREALASLQKLIDQAGNSLVEAESIRQLGTLKTQRYCPLRQWCLEQIAEILEEQPDEREQYLRQIDNAAQTALASVQRSKDPIEAKRAAVRYRLSSHGEQLMHLQADLYLERGWPLQALAVLERVAVKQMRIELPTANETSTQEMQSGPQASLPWWYVWHVANSEAAKLRIVDEWRKSYGENGEIESLDRFAGVWTRVMLASALDPDALGRAELVGWGKAIAASINEDPTRTAIAQANALAVEHEDAEGNREMSTFAMHNSRSVASEGDFDLSVWPVWHHQLERHTAASDKNSASQPRVGERERGTLPYHPVVVDGRVYINEMNQIHAYDLTTGNSWPSHSTDFALFDSQIAAAAYVPLGYPLVGTPRGTLAVADHCLYARMGPPITGWANQEMAEDGGSISYLVGIDLNKQGSMLRGFPLRLLPPSFNGAEFEGCPLIWGQLLLVAVVERDNVGVRRSVAAFDRLSGELRWRSPVLASGVVEGSDRANLITHQLLTMAGGRLFYNTDLGAVVCLDPLTGEIEWLQRYQRSVEQKRSHPSPDRFKYRDLTPCMVANGLVYCMPRDCGELFALDACTGDLVWASDDVMVADAIHLLGVCGDSLLLSGDRLVWLDRRTGRFLQAYPGGTTPGMVNALPSPRGLGRGVISNNEVYWPVAGEVLVFEGDAAQSRQPGAAQAGGVLTILKRHRISSGGSEGGNLVVAEGHLIYCSPSRIMAFASTVAN